MKRHRPEFLILILFIVFISCRNESRSVITSFKELPPIILEHSGSTIFQYWVLENIDAIWGDELGEVPAIHAYRDSLVMIFGEQAIQTTIEKEASQEAHKSVIPQSDSIDNYHLVHDGYLGHIRPVNFVEAQMLNFQIARYPLISHPTEFHGFIAVHDSLNLVRVYIGASDEPFPPRPGPIIDHLDNAVKDGWRLKYHLHNHYSEKEDHYLGVTAPSMADAHYYKMLKERYNVEKALITNGFHTVEISSDEFEKFNSH